MPALRFLHERGMSRRDLAEVVVAQREWAAGNPRAFRRKPVTAEQVLDGPPIAYPFTRDMCCVVTDGGGALVLTSAERAADLPGGGHAVYLLGSGEASEAPLMSQMDDVGSFGAFRRASAEAFATAGVGHADIDHFMGYDAFAHLPLYMLEDVGFVGRGESGAFIAEGHTRKGGSLPMNTNGGGPVVHPHRHVRDVRHPGGRPPAPRAGRRAGARRDDQLRAGRRHVLRGGRQPRAVQPQALRTQAEGKPVTCRSTSTSSAPTASRRSGPGPRPTCCSTRSPWARADGGTAYFRTTSNGVPVLDRGRLTFTS